MVTFGLCVASLLRMLHPRVLFKTRLRQGCLSVNVHLRKDNPISGLIRRRETNNKKKKKKERKRKDEALPGTPEDLDSS